MEHFDTHTNIDRTAWVLIGCLDGLTGFFQTWLTSTTVVVVMADGARVEVKSTFKCPTADQSGGKQ